MPPTIIVPNIEFKEVVGSMTKATDLVCIKKNCEGNKVIGGERMERERESEREREGERREREREKERGRERVSEHAEYSLAQ